MERLEPEIREAMESDSASLVRLFETLDREARYMLHDPGERVLTEAQQRTIVRDIRASEDRTLLVADAQGSIVGFAGATRLAPRRRAHIAQLVVGVLAGHRRRGIGGGLLDAIASWAETSGLSRLELTVAVPNVEAVSLYRSKGYRIEGTRAAALKIGDDFIDEYHMARWLR